MTPESPSWLDHLILYIGLFAAWVSGKRAGWYIRMTGRRYMAHRRR